MTATTVLDPTSESWPAEFAAKYGPAAWTPAYPTKAARPLHAASWGELYCRSLDLSKPETPVPVGRLAERALLTTAGAPAAADFAPPPARTLSGPLYSRVAHAPTTSDTVDYVVDVTSSAPVTATAEGADKGDGQVAVTAGTAAVKTWAVWVQATRQALADAAWLTATVDSALGLRLVNSVETAITSELVGTGGTTAASIAEAVAAVQRDGYTPDTLVGAPGDLAAIATVDLDALRNVWHIEAVPAPTMPTGTLYICDLARAVTVWERDPVVARVAYEHGSDLIANVARVLLELRAAVAVTAPAAIATTPATP